MTDATFHLLLKPLLAVDVHLKTAGYFPWLFQKGVTSPVVGATKIQHMEEAVAALGVKIDAKDMERLEAPYKPHHVIGLY